MQLAQGHPAKNKRA